MYNVVNHEHYELYHVLECVERPHIACIAATYMTWARTYIITFVEQTLSSEATCLERPYILWQHKQGWSFQTGCTTQCTCCTRCQAKVCQATWAMAAWAVSRWDEHTSTSIPRVLGITPDRIWTCNPRSVTQSFSMFNILNMLMLGKVPHFEFTFVYAENMFRTDFRCGFFLSITQ